MVTQKAEFHEAEKSYYPEQLRPCCFELDPAHVRDVKGVTTRTSYELRVSENKVQLMRIRDENGKFRSNSVSILNVNLCLILS